METKSPLQLFRFCPVCGNDELSAVSGKELACSKCGFRYFINMSASVAAVIRNAAGEMLLTVRRHDPGARLLDLPGGFVDPGETAEDAVVREIKEELNLVATEMKFLRTFTNQYSFGGVLYHTLDLLFECKVTGFESIKADDDVSGFEFRNIHEIKPGELGLDSVKLMVKYLQDHDDLQIVSE